MGCWPLERNGFAEDCDQQGYEATHIQGGEAVSTHSEEGGQIEATKREPSMTPTPSPIRRDLTYFAEDRLLAGEEHIFAERWGLLPWQ